MRDKTRDAAALASPAKEASTDRRPNRLTPHRSKEVPNGTHSEPKGESDPDEQERDTHSIHSDMSEEDSQHSEAPKAFEMTPVKTMREKTKDAAARCRRL
jgi:hypothetical protein